MENLQASQAWQVLAAKREAIEAQSLTALFATDPQRFEHYSIEAAGILLDFSKQPVDAAVVADLVALAEARELPHYRDAMFAGERVNETEGRAALHTALRAATETTLPEVKDARARMTSFAEDIRSGAWTGITGAPIKDVINIGIGGSDLGPRLAVDALAPLADGPRIHF
ncbi:MAG: glucose-6-phosphate isomerase, partial [Gammaproteobacteria bacterium]|nr:glucose-6-phosphate isomerase [Gammaproteobacteria bacterium]